MNDTQSTGNPGPLLRVRALWKTFPVRGAARRAGSGRVQAVSGVDVDVAVRECVGLVGESGCGKTTFGRAVLRLVEPDSGTVHFGGEDVLAMGPAELRAFRRRAQIVFQDPFSSLNPRRTTGQTVGEGIRLHGLRRGRRAVAERVRELLSLVGLSPDAAGRYPHEFSGGQRQRVAVARALSVEPSFLVCDEPVSALDVSVQAQVINLLRRLQDELGLATLFIAHDLAVVRHLCDRVLVMYLGKVVEEADAPTLFSAPSHPYTVALLSAVPVPDPRVRTRRIVLQGDVPSPLDPPPGCAFHPRCPVAGDECRLAAPPLAPLADGHRVACHRIDQARQLARRDSRFART